MSFRANLSGYTVDAFEFERTFDHDAFLEWIAEHWTLAVWYAVVYVMLIFGGRRYMENRPRFELRYVLALWSSILAVFSIFGAVRTVPELTFVIRKYGIDYSVCNPSYFYGPTAFWAYTFVISKAYELGDTIFIVLRKQPLIFLHWYHHISVLIYVWYSYTDHTAPGRWFMVMNYTVHSFMYTYYAFRAMRFRFPKWVSMFITSIQLCQMMLGMSVAIRAYMVKSTGQYCQMSFENMRYCLLMYSSYFTLFVYFFYNSYVKKKSTTAEPVTTIKEASKEKTANGLAHINGFNSNMSDKKYQ